MERERCCLIVCVIAYSVLSVQVAARPQCYYTKMPCPLEYAVCAPTSNWYCSPPATTAVCPCPKDGVTKASVAPTQKPSFFSALLDIPNLCADLLSTEINFKPPGKSS